MLQHTGAVLVCNLPRNLLSISHAGVVLPVPASVLSLGAGAIFGLLLGTILVWSGATIGLIGCLFVGRCVRAQMIFILCTTHVLPDTEDMLSTVVILQSACCLMAATARMLMRKGLVCTEQRYIGIQLLEWSVQVPPAGMGGLFGQQIPSMAGQLPVQHDIKIRPSLKSLHCCCPGHGFASAVHSSLLGFEFQCWGPAGD